jgi:hypothetical protein
MHNPLNYRPISAPFLTYEKGTKSGKNKRYTTLNFNFVHFQPYFPVLKKCPKEQKIKDNSLNYRPILASFVNVQPFLKNSPFFSHLFRKMCKKWQKSKVII